MDKTLHITNGDSAVHIMEQANIEGDILPWRDVLHDGPVPANLSLIELSKIRAQFIIGQDWGNAELIRQHFAERDEQLQNAHRYDKITLWFEHDLYDQLQLLQILDWFAEHPLTNTTLTMICTDQYLGCITPEQMVALRQYETNVTAQQLTLAQQAWTAYRQPTPETWCALLKQDTSALPFLAGAIQRSLEEYPNIDNGLSRTAYTALSIIANGESRPGWVFHHNQEQEARIFMGDLSFWKILHELLESNPPLIQLPKGETLTHPSNPKQALTITEMGEAVLANEKNWLDYNRPDRWIGGVHIDTQNIWCWEPTAKNIKKSIKH